MNTTIKISNPTPYNKSKEVFDELTGEMKTITTPMIRFIVTGSPEAVALYYKDQCDDLTRQGKKPAEKDSNGNPMIHFNKITGVKYGEEAILTRDLNDKGQAIYFMEEDSSKELKEMLGGANAVTQRLFAERELENLIGLSKTYAKNKAVNRTNYRAILASKATSGVTTQEEAEIDKM